MISLLPFLFDFIYTLICHNCCILLKILNSGVVIHGYVSKLTGMFLFVKISSATTLGCSDPVKKYILLLGLGMISPKG